MATGYYCISTGRSDTATQCEHCGRVIIRFAYVRSRQTQKEYKVGMDCMQTLCAKGQPIYRQLSFKF